MFITIILILMSHNLAIGVVIDTLIYYVIHFILQRKEDRRYDNLQ